MTIKSPKVPIIETKTLSKAFNISGSEKIQVLSDLTFTVASGEFVCIMGPSGSGKSTLLNILASIEEITNGTVLISGKNLSKVNEKALLETRRHTSSIIYQDFNLLNYLTALQNVMFPITLAGNSEEEARKIALELLKKVNLTERADHYPDDLSGGEQQRVAIARALANHAKLLLADEPTGNLDTKTGDTIMQIFRDLVKNDGLTIIMVTHDIRLARKTDRILILRDGKLYREDELVEVN